MLNTQYSLQPAPPRRAAPHSKRSVAQRRAAPRRTTLNRAAARPGPPGRAAQMIRDAQPKRMLHITGNRSIKNITIAKPPPEPTIETCVSQNRKPHEQIQHCKCETTNRNAQSKRMFHKTEKRHKPKTLQLRNRHQNEQSKNLFHKTVNRSIKNIVITRPHFFH